jgi:uncharacterized protein involved in exopolysaccharide biosynthesis
MFKRFWWVFLVMLPVGAMAGLFFAAIVTYVMPKKYESKAVIEVRPVTSPSNDDPMTPQTTPQYFHGTEFNKIKSRASLAKVVEKLELVNKWNVDQETAIRMLKEIVSTDNIRGTDLIAIRVRHTDREGTRDIAVELARIYRDHRVELVQRDRHRDLAELNKAVKEQEEKVEERRKILLTIARTGSFLARPDMTEEDVKKAMDELRAQDVIDARRDLEKDQVLLQKMKFKQIGENITAKMDGESMIIHEEPQVPQVPVSPNVTLNLLLGAVGGFLLSPLLALPVMALLNRLNPVGVDGQPVLH